jgi:hypothetical protein
MAMMMMGMTMMRMMMMMMMVMITTAYLVHEANCDTFCTSALLKTVPRSVISSRFACRMCAHSLQVQQHHHHSIITSSSSSSSSSSSITRIIIIVVTSIDFMESNTGTRKGPHRSGFSAVRTWRSTNCYLLFMEDDDDDDDDVTFSITV